MMTRRNVSTSSSRFRVRLLFLLTLTMDVPAVISFPHATPAHSFPPTFRVACELVKRTFNRFLYKRLMANVLDERRKVEVKNSFMKGMPYVHDVSRRGEAVIQ